MTTETRAGLIPRYAAASQMIGDRRFDRRLGHFPDRVSHHRADEGLGSAGPAVAAAGLRRARGGADHLQAPGEHRPVARGDGEPVCET